MQTFFREFAEERWADAAGSLQLTDLDQWRRLLADGARRQQRMKADSAREDFISHQFAGVRDPGLLDTLPLPEIAARWLQAQHPSARFREELRANGCPPNAALDTALRKVSITIVGTVVHRDSAWVLFRIPWVPQSDSGMLGQAPQVARLVRGQTAEWRILPRHDLFNRYNVSTHLMGCPKPAQSR